MVNRNWHSITSWQYRVLSFFSDAGNCFIEKGKNDTIYSPESISLTFKKLKSSGGYEGKVSWEPFKGKLGDHTSFLKSPLRSACIKRSARHSPWINAYNTSLTVFSVFFSVFLALPPVESMSVNPTRTKRW